MVTWAGIIFLLSHIPDLKTGLSFDFALRKLGHILVFAMLGFLFLWSQRFLRQIPNPKAAMLLVFLYALVDEWHQSFVAGRSASLRDVGVDFLGGLLSPVLLSLWKKVLSYFHWH